MKNEEKMKEQIYGIILDAEKQGDIYQPQVQIVARCQAEYPCMGKETILQMLTELSQDGTLVHEGDTYAVTTTRHNEQWLARCIAGYIRRNTPPDSFDTAKVVFDAESRLGVRLSESQRQAAAGSLGHRLSIVTGGPGAGKTTMLKVLCEAFSKVTGKDILLMAPTGKATRKMAQETGREASTVHSAIYCGRYIRRYEDGELAPGLVVVDEASMLSVNLLADLLRSLSPSTQIILVGDPAQLPAVGPGQILTDLLDSGLPVHHLTDNFRQQSGSILAEDIVRIRNGQTSLLYDGKDTYFMPTTASGDAEMLALSLYAASRAEGHQTQILTPIGRRGIPCSAQALNDKARDLVNPPNAEKLEVVIDGISYRVGDTIIQKHNNEFAKNGDVGTIVRIAGGEEPELAIKFEFSESVVVYTASAIKEDKLLDLAYALTVHRSQGSEYDCVIVPLVQEHIFSWYNNMVYTAASRAKKRLILVGDASVLEHAIRTPAPLRQGKLLEHIVRELAPSMGWAG